MSKPWAMLPLRYVQKGQVFRYRWKKHNHKLYMCLQDASSEEGWVFARRVMPVECDVQKLGYSPDRLQFIDIMGRRHYVAPEDRVWVFDADNNPKLMVIDVVECASDGRPYGLDTVVEVYAPDDGVLTDVQKQISRFTTAMRTDFSQDGALYENKINYEELDPEPLEIDVNVEWEAMRREWRQRFRSVPVPQKIKMLADRLIGRIYNRSFWP